MLTNGSITSCVNHNLFQSAISRYDWSLEWLERKIIIELWINLLLFASVIFRVLIVLLIKTEKLLNLLFLFCCKPNDVGKDKALNLSLNPINNIKTNHGCIHQNYIMNTLLEHFVRMPEIYVKHIHTACWQNAERYVLRAVNLSSLVLSDIDMQ